ncbi:stromal cell-derived factor 1-like [Oncorhynchus kisutch]|nr:stromal cell-derived factor 1-like [Oncorhynchus kisutch]
MHNFNTPTHTFTVRSGLYIEQIIGPVSLIMDLKYLAVMAVLAVATYAPFSQAKPISLVERCWCRSTVNTVPQRNIRELKFLHTPNCPFQVIAKLKNHKEVCINPETKWLQQYLKNALNKMKTSKQTN